MPNETKKLLQQVRELILSARNIAVRGVNTLQVLTNFEIGRLIVEHEQRGKKRAQYGKQIINELSKELSTEFGRGFSKRNLEYMRRFYMEWRPKIDTTTKTSLAEVPQTAGLSEFAERDISITQTLSAEFGSKFILSWSHYVFLMAINDKDERSFYEIEAANNNWSLRELKRQFDTGLYERLALSKDKDKVKELSTKGQIIERPEDMLKEPTEEKLEEPLQTLAISKRSQRKLYGFKMRISRSS